ncbi:hypothetical protein [Bradyrhizobium sp.]|jgi:hypothetical protein|uniref:hypothetical protein n=1 Tax=Bradyrhizobium sp. TaxID=376 RepID=UPI003C235BAD
MTVVVINAAAKFGTLELLSGLRCGSQEAERDALAVVDAEFGCWPADKLRRRKVNHFLIDPR